MGARLSLVQIRYLIRSVICYLIKGARLSLDQISYLIRGTRKPSLEISLSQEWDYFRDLKRFSMRVHSTLALTAAWAVMCVHPTIFAPLRGLSPVASHVFLRRSMRPGISVHMRMRERREGGKEGGRRRREKE